MTPSFPKGTAAERGYLCCPICCHTQAEAQGYRCEICATKLTIRKTSSIQKTLALLVTAWLLYIPANVLPIMQTTQLGRLTENTIIGGVLTLWHHGSYPIAIVIFVASVLVPVLKMLAIGWLCWEVSSNKAIEHETATHLYHLTELVGKWSMIDVFVVALLVALIQVGSLMSIGPGPAALAFAGVVVATMLSAQAFDVRMIWDKEAKS